MQMDSSCGRACRGRLHTIVYSIYCIYYTSPRRAPGSASDSMTMPISAGSSSPRVLGVLVTTVFHTCSAAAGWGRECVERVCVDRGGWGGGYYTSCERPEGSCGRKRRTSTQSAASGPALGAPQAWERPARATLGPATCQRHVCSSSKPLAPHLCARCRRRRSAPCTQWPARGCACGTARQPAAGQVLCFLAMCTTPTGRLAAQWRVGTTVSPPQSHAQAATAARAAAQTGDSLRLGGATPNRSRRRHTRRHTSAGPTRAGGQGAAHFCRPSASTMALPCASTEMPSSSSL